MRSYLLPFVILLPGCGRLGYELLAGATQGTDDPGGGSSPSDDSGVDTPPGDDGPGGDGAGDDGADDGGSLRDAGVGDASSPGGPTDAGERAPDAGDDGGVSEPADDLALGKACAFAAITVIQSGRIVDDNAVVALVGALQANCLRVNPPVTTYVSQDDPGVLDPATDRPLVSAEQLVVAVGGPSVHRAVSYLNQADTPVVSSVDPQDFTYELRERATDDLILRDPDEAFSSTRDVAVIEVAYEPIARTTALLVYGNESLGTLAGIEYFASHMPGQLAANSARFYVVEWVEADGTEGPSDGDQYTVLASR